MAVKSLLIIIILLVSVLTSYATDSITVTDITDNRIFQRDIGGTTVDIVLSGTYTGDAPASIQGKVVNADGHAEVLAYADLTSTTIAGGTWTGTINNVPQGGMYHIWVQGGGVSDENNTNSWGVGILINIIGQSNGRYMSIDGYCTDHAEGGDDLTANASLHYFDGTNWTQPTTNNNGSVKLGNDLITALGIPVGIINKAIGSEPLMAEAGNGGSHPGWLGNSPTFAKQSPYTTNLAAVTNAGGKVEFVLWVGSESDGGKPDTLSNYEGGLAALWSYLKADIDPNVKLIFNTLARFADDGNGTLFCPSGSPANLPNWGLIRNATIKFINANTNVYLGCNAVDIPISTYSVHYTDPGYTTLGQRLANTILHSLNSGTYTYYRGPYISAITKASATQIDVTITHRGGTDFTPTSSITGFRLFDGTTSNEETITAAERTSATNIRLTTSGSIDGTAIVEYMYDSNPTISGLVKDNSALTLPLEPYASDADAVGTAWDEVIEPPKGLFGPVTLLGSCEVK